jgi:hypothetical protein
VICSKERPFASNENWLRKVWFGWKQPLILVTPRTRDRLASGRLPGCIGLGFHGRGEWEDEDG